MKHPDTPISERVRAELGEPSPGLKRDLDMVERLAAGKVSHVAANGTHPRDWTLERWMQVVAFSVGLAAAIVGGLWVGGGEWERMRAAVKLVPMLVEGQAATRLEVQQIGVVVDEIKDEQRRVMEELAVLPRPTTRKPSPPATFPRSEQSFFSQRPRE